ncbi:helix-turn-helix domain-containing protein [Tenacibaculum jejuense]|uniref:Helix-turn-helix domain-containing protein n=1 Tax=Tenacibaculum jejuense TaxID=584609 RepID=A0A238U797_9FLAO|nr:helix-turn-helix domain-containing protein [Tenacibaculum jejuense]SNR14468.1 conserved protein of unknown function [Tenacibaculum jejuense]
MELDRREFFAWMDRIQDRFDLLDEKIARLQRQKNVIEGEQLLDNQDVLTILKVSSRTLQRYRSSGKLPYYAISGKTYYRLSDINHFIKALFKNPVTPK